ncbi:MAG: ABC transporter ATP-binding protein [Acetobacteraceae bacterium]|nr:ABC transporter ATP-binding protein [Acetobacteraceae bacterium]
MGKLVLQGIGKRYGEGLRAVADVTLALTEGEFVSLLGPSGCGKTTTLRMIAGFMAPTEGTISVGGTVLSSATSVVPPERRGMSMIFQSYAIWPNMTVRENVAFGLTLRKLGRAEVTRRTDTMLDIVKLKHLADRYPSELSGGQQQRVALARAIVIEPQVLLLDEPLSNLDASLREEMRSEIRRLHDEFRITTVYVTHDQSEAMVTSDRIVVMNAGRIEQCADPVSLYTRPQTRFVAGFVGRTNFLDGTLAGNEIRFPGFTVPAALAPGHLDPRPSFSIRPQSIRLHTTEPTDRARCWWVQGQVVERAYLGEYWDYLVAPAEGGLRLKVSAAPVAMHQVGDTVWLEIDPSTAAPIPPPKPAA